MTQTNKSTIRYFGRSVQVACDRQCQKAWGITQRPRVQLSEDGDDYAFLADGELGDAPADPGTYEGGYGKPSSPDGFPNKWCVRECERCEIADVGEPIKLSDFGHRLYNQPWKHEDQS